MEAGSVAIGTRGSALARWQAEWAAHRLRAAWPGLEVRLAVYTTAGDRILDRPLPEIGGKGLFTAEIESGLRAGEIDLAVHSLKDLPVEDAAGLCLAAICERADARDVLVSREGWTLQTLPGGARLGTCSLRRSAQALAARPDLQVQPVRGNVDTRVAKVRRGEYEAILLAAAGVERLGLQAEVSETLPLDVMLPAPGQGALAVQCRADDERVRRLAAALDHAPTRCAVTAERAFLRSLGGGCSAPVAAFAEFPARGLGRLTGWAAAPDGGRGARVTGEGDDPEALGAGLAREWKVRSGK